MQGAKEGAVHRVHFVHALDLLSHDFWRSEAHGDVDTADYQDSFLCFHLAGYVCRQAPVAGWHQFGALPARLQTWPSFNRQWPQ